MPADTERGASDSPGAKHGTSLSKPQRIESRELLNGRNELIILHQGREYRLRVTQNKKLILVA
jgi:hemin uptake protein HemP